jgi:hypothetical protein
MQIHYRLTPATYRFALRLQFDSSVVFDLTCDANPALVTHAIGEQTAVGAQI